MPRTCFRCGDDLPCDAPPGVATCRQYATAVARARGDMLTEEMAHDLTLYAGLCAIDVAIRDGDEEVDFER